MGKINAVVRYGVVAVVFGVVWCGLGLAAEDDAALRKKVLHFNEVTGDRPMAGAILSLTKEDGDGKKIIAVAARLAKDKQHPLNINALRILSTAALALKEYDAAEAFYRLFIDDANKLRSSRKVALGYVGLITTLNTAKKYDQCEKECLRFMEVPEFDDKDELENNEDKQRRHFSIENAHYLVLGQLVTLMVKKDKGDDAVRMLNKMIRANESQLAEWRLLEIKGALLRRLSRSAEAAKTYEEIINSILKNEALTKPEKEDLAEDSRYALSGVYVDLKKIDKAVAQLQTLLENNPDSPTYNNDLGFVWADNNMNLDQAEKLIRKALEEDKKQQLKSNPTMKPADYKDNPSYLDSLAWVLYKKKQYAEAKKYMLMCVKDEEEGQNFEICDHLADIHLALGEKADAVKVWKKGLEHATKSKRDQERMIEVEKKIKANEEK